MRTAGTTFSGSVSARIVVEAMPMLLWPGKLQMMAVFSSAPVVYLLLEAITVGASLSCSGCK